MESFITYVGGARGGQGTGTGKSGANIGRQVISGEIFFQMYTTAATMTFNLLETFPRYQINLFFEFTKHNFQFKIC